MTSTLNGEILANIAQHQPIAFVRRLGYLLDQVGAYALADPHDSSADRMINKRNPIPIILIVCEGTSTEPQYFQSFRIVSAHIKGVGHVT